MTKSNSFSVRKQHKNTSADLSRLNREMALQMIMLATKTGEIQPLIDAVKAMRTAQELYTRTTTPIENAQIQKKLGDVLLSVGSSEDDMRALKYSILAYRGAITIASLLGADDLRNAARINYAKALQLSGHSGGKPTISLMGAA